MVDSVGRALAPQTRNLQKSSSQYEQQRFFEDRWSLPRSKSPRLGAWSEEFLGSVLHKKTRSRYRSSIHNIFSHFGKDIRLSEITVDSVFRFQQARLEQGAGKATVNRLCGKAQRETQPPSSYAAYL